MDKGGVPYGPFDQPTFVGKPFRQDALENARRPGYPQSAPYYPPYAAGDVIQGLDALWRYRFMGPRLRTRQQPNSLVF